MRKRLRKKRHREYLTAACGHIMTFDDGLRDRLFRSEPGTPFRIDGSCSSGMRRLIEGRRLRYWVTVARRLAPASAVAVYWAEEFPSVRGEGVLFSAADFGPPQLRSPRSGRSPSRPNPALQPVGPPGGACPGDRLLSRPGG
jgi:hypothetical protein